MFDSPDICWKCEYNIPVVVLTRCTKCLILGCEHNRRDAVCITGLNHCADGEHTKVLRAWRDELNKSGTCVSYSYRFDECCKELDWTENGDWVCRYCEKNIGKVPPPDSCAGCGGHSIDPDCPLHGETRRKK